MRKKQSKQKTTKPTTPKKPAESQVRKINRKLSDISSYNAKQRDKNLPLPAPFYSSAPVAKSTEKVVYSRQLQPDDIFLGSYDLYGLMVPPYSPTQLYSMYESSSILSPHIDAYVQNIDGFDIIFKYIGPTGKKDSDNAKKDKKRLTDFFRKANERQSFKTVRRAMRIDYEVLGYGYMEVTRSQDGEIACIYSTQAKYIRLANLTKEIPQEITVKLPRNGKDKPITIRKKFRRYAQVLPGAAKGNIRWFKEYGDSRQMDAVTGKFEEEAPVKDPASELIHLKNGEDIYGLPRWIGNVLGVIGVRSADYINYDLFDSQGIPPLVIMISGGILTQDSMDTIEGLLRQAKGYQNFNRILLLEAQAEGGIDDKLVPKIDLKPLNEARAEDAMFQKYIASTEEKLRMDFRLPMIYVGRCHDEETETLTEEGFKFYEQITPDDKIATVKPETGELEFHKPNKMIVYEYNGDMIHFNSRVMDIMVTPNHNMWVANYNHNKKDYTDKFYKIEADKVKSLRWLMAVPSVWKGSDEITEITIPFLPVHHGIHVGKEPELKPIPLDIFLEFLGYYLSEGHIPREYNKKGGLSCRYNIEITQTKEQHIDKMRISVENMSEYGFRKIATVVDKRDNNQRFSLVSKSLYYWLKENCGRLQKDRRIPRWVFKLKREKLQVLYNAMMAGDGHISKRHESNQRYSSISRQLTNDFQELCVRLGRRSSVYCSASTGVFNVMSTDRQKVLISETIDHIQKVPYKGIVYCFDVPNHLFVTRRNDKITVQGNSSDYNRAVIEHSRIIAEEQVFEPERNIEDEIYNNTIMTELDSKFWAFKSGGPPLVTGEGLMRGFDSVSKAGILTINQSLEIANRALGLDFEEIIDEWANYPLSIIERLLDRGFFADLQQLIDVLEGNASATNNPTVLMEEPAAGGSDDLNTDINKTLNSILNKAKDQLLSNKIRAENNKNKAEVELEE